MTKTINWRSGVIFSSVFLTAVLVSISALSVRSGDNTEVLMLRPPIQSDESAADRFGRFSSRVRSIDAQLGIATPKPPSAEDSTQLMLLKREITRLDAAVARIETKLDARAHEIPTEKASRYVGDTVENVIEELEEHRLEEQRRTIENFAQIGDSFETQSADIGWATDARDSIHRALHSSAPEGTHATQVECRATLCRLELWHEDTGNIGDFVRRFPSLVDHLMPRLAISQSGRDDGTVDMTIYLMRDGHTFEHFM